MKVVVTGATGLIGATLLRKLSGKVDIVGLSRGNEHTGIIQTDYAVDNLSSIFDKTDVVVHLAAIRGEGNSYRHFIDNTILTENVLQAGIRAQVKKIVFMSSIAVYSDVNRVPWTEDQPLSPQTFYGLSKITGEHLCQLYSHQGIDYTIFRCGIVLGITNNNRMTDVFIRNAIEKKPITVKGKSIAKRDFIYLKDVVDALCWSILDETGNNQIYNLGSGNAYTNLQIAEEINRVMDNEGNLIYIEDCDEGIKDSRMDSSKLRSAGFCVNYNLSQALNDIKEDWGKKLTDAV